MTTAVVRHWFTEVISKDFKIHYFLVRKDVDSTTWTLMEIGVGISESICIEYFAHLNIELMVVDTDTSIYPSSKIMSVVDENLDFYLNF